MQQISKVFKGLPRPNYIDSLRVWVHRFAIHCHAMLWITQQCTFGASAETQMNHVSELAPYVAVLPTQRNASCWKRNMTPGSCLCLSGCHIYEPDSCNIRRTSHPSKLPMFFGGSLGHQTWFVCVSAWDIKRGSYGFQCLLQ